MYALHCPMGRFKIEGFNASSSKTTNHSETTSRRHVCQTKFKEVKMVDKPTCYKNPMNPSCIGLNLTNSPKYFRNSNVFDTGVSDFHKMIA